MVIANLIERRSLNTGIAIGPILFVVAILAVLIGAIAAGSGGIGGNSSAERVRVQSGALIQYLSNVRNGVIRLRAGGCEDIQISAESPANGLVNPQAPVDRRCHIFYPTGGNITYASGDEFLPRSLIGSSNNPPYFQTGFPGWSITDRRAISGLGFNSGTYASELVMVIGVPLDYCMEINRLLGINWSGPLPPTGTVVLKPHSGGLGTNTWDGNTASFDLNGQISMCYRFRVNGA
jgi:type II secretory pathway pseudopilin PulG